MSLYVNIKKSFSSFKLDVQFEAENEILALLGASGCGKSITLRCIAGIIKPDEGIIRLDDRTLFDSKKGINLSPQKRKTGLLFQNYALFPNMTVENNIAFGIINSSGKQEKKQKIERLLHMFYLEGLERHLPRQLSGGQQQRVALARILASEPQMLMLDEPFSALDSYLRWQLEQEVSTLLHEFKGTTLFVSHNRDEVYRICDRISVVSDGKIEVTGDKWELFKNPKTYAGSLLTGCKNSSAVRPLSSNVFYSDDWCLALETDKKPDTVPKYIGIRARTLEWCETLSEPNSFEYEIVKEIQDTFSYILMIRPKNQPNAKPLRWEMSKTDFLHRKDAPQFVKINTQNLLLLE